MINSDKGQSPNSQLEESTEQRQGPLMDFKAVRGLALS